MNYKDKINSIIECLTEEDGNHAVGEGNIKSAISELKELNQALNIDLVSKSFLKKYGDFPTANIERNGKKLTQQRAKKEHLIKHLADKYPDWTIVESNFC